MLKKIIRATVERRLIITSIKKLKTLPKKVRILLDKILSYPAIKMISLSTPVEENTILFLTTRGEYDCNAKWICNEIIRRNLPYKIYWTYRKGSISEFPTALHLVKRGDYDFYQAVSKAKIIIDNSTSLSYLWYTPKRKQVLIETWHGSIGIKRVTKENVQDKTWVRHAFREGKMTDYCISNSTFEDAVYREDYWKKTPILKLGHARNDILCEHDTQRVNELRDHIYNLYGMEKHKKICLYAPTFRDDNDMRPYQIDYEKLKTALHTRFGGEWVILIRYHFKMLKKIKFNSLIEDVIDVSKYPDIQELLACTDVGITDYSSWICDYLLTYRPGFLFATDMAEYGSDNRGFYYPLESMPFPLAINNEQLIDNILKFDNEKFEKDSRLFIQEKGCIDDGHASERIVDAIEKIMRGEKV